MSDTIKFGLNSDNKSVSHDGHENLKDTPNESPVVLYTGEKTIAEFPIEAAKGASEDLSIHSNQSAVSISENQGTVNPESPISSVVEVELESLQASSNDLDEDKIEPQDLAVEENGIDAQGHFSSIEPEINFLEANEQVDDVNLSSGSSHQLDSLDLSATVEAILFASSKPLKVGDILEVLGDETVTTKEVSEVISSLVRFYKSRKGGFRLENIRGGYQFQTVPEAGHVMEKIFSSRPRPISRAAQETLAIIAYRQPVTRADIEFIRGVDAGSIMKNLLDRNLIRCVGRREDSGRPMLFGTTDEFLTVYNLNTLADLPPLEAFQPSHEIIKNALQVIDDGDKMNGPNDFVGNYDDQAQVAYDPSAQEIEPVGSANEIIHDEFFGVFEENLPADANSLSGDGKPTKTAAKAGQKPITGASKNDNPDSETLPQGVFLGGLDGGFNDDETEEENEY